MPAPTTRPCLICGRPVEALATRAGEAPDDKGRFFVVFIHEDEDFTQAPCLARVRAADVVAFLDLTGPVTPVH